MARTFTKEHKEKLSLAKRGKSSWNKGKKLSAEHKRKLSLAKLGKPAAHAGKSNPKTQGERHYNWKGGVTSVNEALRHSLEYRLWRTAVFERDNYTCIWCGVRGGVLNADHIKPWALYPELRFAIDNGRTLCIACHKTTDTYGSKTKSHG